MDGGAYPRCGCGRLYVPTPKSPAACLMCLRGKLAVPDLKVYESDLLDSFMLPLPERGGEVIIRSYFSE